MIYRNLPIASFQTVKATAPYRGTMPSSDFKRRFSVFLLWSTLVTKSFQASNRKKFFNSRQIVCGFVTILYRGKKKTRPTRWYAFNAKKRALRNHFGLFGHLKQVLRPLKVTKKFWKYSAFVSQRRYRFGGLSAEIDEHVLHCDIVALHLFDMNKKTTCLLPMSQNCKNWGVNLGPFFVCHSCKFHKRYWPVDNWKRGFLTKLAIVWHKRTS